MESISEMKDNINSARNVTIRLQSYRTDTVRGHVRDSDLIIDLHSAVESCDNENRDPDADKKCFLKEFNFEEDIERLIEVSKQFQTDYENEKAKSDAVLDDNCLNIPILSSNSQSNKQFTPTIPHPGPFGTGIIRPSPKKHSCVQKKEAAPTKRSDRFVWNVKPYTSRYYNFDRTHPNLRLVESGVSMIPKRVSKETVELTARSKSSTSIAVKPLLDRELTWHEFFERCNVYSAKSFQSSYGDTHTTVTKPPASELLTPKSNDNSKIQKHILPQLNIRGECSVQQIPEISIAPCVFKRTINTNIKLVEIIYEESDSKVETVVERSEEVFEKVEQKTTEPVQLQGEQNAPELTSENLELLHIDESANSSLKTSLTTSSRTPSKSNGYDSSLEESVSLNVSRASACHAGFRDHDIIARSLKDVGIQTQNFRKISTPRKEGVEGKAVTFADHNRLEFGPNYLVPQEQHQEIKLPTFPKNELVQMVDEIFDTSSEAVNMSCKYIVKETSVQTDIVWENINDMFRQQNQPTVEYPTEAVEIKFTESHVYPNANNVDQIIQTDESRVPPNILEEIEEFDSRNLLQEVQPVERCHHIRLKKIKICSCLACKSNIRFSSMNVDRSRSRQQTSSDSSPVFNPGPVRSSAKTNLFPSERYKRMKQAQREHFENDPRISRTLKKIYATAKRNELRKETTSSSSSGHYRQLNAPPREFSTYDDEVLEPDLFTFDDELLLFGLESCDEIQYSSNLLKTESSQDTSVSVGKHYSSDDLTNTGNTE